MSFRPGAIGTLTGTLGKVDIKTSAKGKRWVMFTIKRGKQTLTAKSFVDAVVTGLEMFVEGEELSVFGKVTTDTDKKDASKSYTNFTALKLYDETQDDQGITVAGEIIAIRSNEYGQDVWVDTTENEAYPEQVKFQVPKGVKLPFGEGDVITGAKLEPKGKFCFWTLETGISPEKDSPKDYKGKVVLDLSESTYERAPEPTIKPIPPSVPEMDEDIPF